jgi:hypothetical protein
VRERALEPWRRVPPTLGAIYRLRYDEATIHNEVPPLTNGEGGPRDRFGMIVHRDGFRSAYVVAVRVRRTWRLVVWLRGRPRPTATWSKPTARASVLDETVPA